MKTANTPKPAPLNRRLMAAMIDAILIISILSPAINAMVAAISNGGDIPTLMMAYTETHAGDTMNISDVIHYLDEHNAFVPFILSQFILLTALMAYYVIFWTWQGATIGKMLLRIKVVNAKDGAPVSMKQAWLRILGYIAAALTLSIGFIMIDFRKDKKGLHDIIAGTQVIVCT